MLRAKTGGCPRWQAIKTVSFRNEAHRPFAGWEDAHDGQLPVAFPVLEGRNLMLATLLPAGGLTFLFRQESKQRSRPGEALHKIFRYGAVVLTFLPDFIAALSRPSPGAARQFPAQSSFFSNQQPEHETAR